jgi:hypothetical protein
MLGTVLTGLEVAFGFAAFILAVVFGLQRVDDPVVSKSMKSWGPNVYGAPPVSAGHDRIAAIGFPPHRAARYRRRRHHRLA